MIDWCRRGDPNDLPLEIPSMNVARLNWVGDIREVPRGMI
jgi:hypothetical protein